MTLDLKIQGKFKKKKKAKYENINLKRPLLLDAESDLKLRSMIVSPLTAGARINVDVVEGVLIGLVQSNHGKFDKYLSFHVSRFWVRSLHQRRKVPRRATTTSRPVITHSL